MLAQVHAAEQERLTHLLGGDVPLLRRKGKEFDFGELLRIAGRSADAMNLGYVRQMHHLAWHGCLSLQVDLSGIRGRRANQHRNKIDDRLSTKGHEPLQSSRYTRSAVAEFARIRALSATAYGVCLL